jgi:hypothetical protein
MEQWSCLYYIKINLYLIYIFLYSNEWFHKKQKGTYIDDKNLQQLDTPIASNLRFLFLFLTCPHKRRDECYEIFT